MVSQSRPLYSDKDLVGFLLQDDRRGIEILFKQYYTQLFRFVKLIMKDKAVSEDIVLEVFSNLWKIRYKLPDNVILRPYLFKAAKNQALNKLRKEERNQLIFDYPENIPSNQYETSNLLEAQELKDKINYAIALLPPKCQLIFKLSRYEDMSYREIADHLDISIKTVENQMVKALKNIRARLQPYLSGD